MDALGVWYEKAQALEKENAALRRRVEELEQAHERARAAERDAKVKP